MTGGASGIGYELVSILYHAGGTVYIGGRSEEKSLQAIKEIQSRAANAPAQGQIKHLSLELDNLDAIKESVQRFTSMESRLDVLWNNAGVSLPPAGSTSKQGHELQMATNCLGPYLFTQLLKPTLRTTAQEADLPPGSVRVIWTSSFVIESSAPKGGIVAAQLGTPPRDKTANYVSSKVGNWFLASELAREVGDDGILSLAQNPGNLKTNLLRHVPWMKILSYPLLHQARFGAYTELWAGTSHDVTMEDNGGYIVPWGRLHPSPRQDLLQALKTIEEGGTGQAQEFQNWCKERTRDFL